MILINVVLINSDSYFTLMLYYFTRSVKDEEFEVKT